MGGIDQAVNAPFVIILGEGLEHGTTCYCL